jgi:DNA-binding MarR family transcriptional regulator
MPPSSPKPKQRLSASLDPQAARRRRETEESGWTFLSNHSHVIICLARDAEMRVRDIALAVGITERAVIRIIVELEEAGYIRKERVGRRNRYSIASDKHLRHPLEAHHSIRSILALARK